MSSVNNYSKSLMFSPSRVQFVLTTDLIPHDEDWVLVRCTPYAYERIKTALMAGQSPLINAFSFTSVDGSPAPIMKLKRGRRKKMA